jgi:hypothetical protein
MQLILANKKSIHPFPQKKEKLDAKTPYDMIQVLAWENHHFIED